ncbi:hypothetical protein SteCoe_16617 [Stentor coeruleus]|uniref:Uncharacterized protein n=1 Tax=Stentor coeruleus TaxID=5963 RepID=A0A1R2C0U6_9CILI|nr:hypothetical protein SteCoe_16617 [Stentor coeruleus]
MDRSFECPVCFEQYSSEVKPLVIPCGHTVCSPCLKSLAKNRTLECPVCRSTHHNINLDTLSPNYALIQTGKSGIQGSSQLWDRIEEVHKQLTNLQNFSEDLEENIEKFRTSLTKTKNDAKGKLDLLISTATNSYNTVISSLENEEKNFEAKVEKIKTQIKNLQDQRSDLMNSLQASYNSNVDLPPNTKLVLSTLTPPKAECSVPIFSLKGDNLDATEKIKHWFGNLTSEIFSCQIEQELLSPKTEEKEEYSGIGKGRGEDRGKGRGDNNYDYRFRGRGGDDRGRGRGFRGKGDHREEVKQPRQGRVEGNLWLVENRFGKWEKLPAWFDAQLKAAQERGEQEIVILDNNRPAYLVKFAEGKSYILRKSGELGKANRIRFEAEL